MKKITRNESGFYSDSDKHLVIKAYLSSNLTKQAIWEEYIGRGDEHGTILKWMRELGYPTPDKKRRFIDHQRSSLMATQSVQSPSDDFEKQQLEKRIAELEKQLKDAEMKTIAYSTMVDIAEKELKISIRKKYNTKP